MSKERESKKTGPVVDEEEKRMLEKVEMIKTRNPETIQYVERKMMDKGIARMDRHPADGRGGIGHPPPKSGRGGKFTWEGPGGPVEDELDPAPPAIDPRDPNYVEEGDEEERTAVIGEVEVAKVAEAREGVSRFEVGSIAHCLLPNLKKATAAMHLHDT